MRSAIRSLLLALALVLAIAVPTHVSADSGCGGTGKPACTILRPVAAPAHRGVPSDAPACVVAVGGLGSRHEDGYFDPILDGLGTGADGRALRTFRFGQDRGELYPYDTSGAIDRSGAQLRRLIRDLSDECFTIGVLAHSMGGVVADRAFSLGMSSREGVTAYVPLASPHNGSFTARAVRLGVELDDTFARVASTVAGRAGIHDPTSPAVADLAERRPPRPPRGVATVRQKYVHDLIVLHGDAVDRRSDVRHYTPASLDEVDGHGAIVRHPMVREMARRTLIEGTVPPDERSGAEIRAAAVAGRTVERYWGGLVAVGGLALAEVALGSAIGSAIRERDMAPLGAFVERVGAHVPEAIELVDAAVAVRTPVPIAMFETIAKSLSE